jgi:septum formation protein
MIVKKKLILASRSPRRQHLLRQIGIRFEVRESNIEEVFDSSKSMEENVRTIALQKAMAVASTIDNAIVVGADTIVVLKKRIFGKPKNKKDALKMLTLLSGRTHNVYTGFALVDRPSNASISAVEVTKVKFRTLSNHEIQEYIHSGSPMDKAGAYGIQDDYGAVFVEKIDGCFYNVVGLPLTRFYTTIRKFQQQLHYI